MLVKDEEPTDPDYGVDPRERELGEYVRKGVINLDKPANPTSHQVSAWAKEILKVEKIGHGGTLDPRVTGVLPLAILDATKIVQALLPAGKEYVCVMNVHGDFSEEELLGVCKEFVGKIYQKPPLRSSVKRRVRVREMYYVDVLEVEKPYVLMRVGCQAGTYMRKLCYDIGEVLGCGAHMKELRRTRAGCFKEDDTLVTLQDVKDGYVFWEEEGDEGYLRNIIQPLEFGLNHLPKIVIRDSAVDAICHGADLAAPGVLKLHEKIKAGELVALFTQKGEGVTLARTTVKSDKIAEINHGIVAKTERVIMERGSYPKSWKKEK
ncbi:MAG: RNA-guided pseudouridylation complex pseudouridine synthase subunit Cbf5 [Candidatus Hodarchaeota archaeon]